LRWPCDKDLKELTKELFAPVTKGAGINLPGFGTTAANKKGKKTKEKHDDHKVDADFWAQAAAEQAGSREHDPDVDDGENYCYPMIAAENRLISIFRYHTIFSCTTPYIVQVEHDTIHRSQSTLEVFSITIPNFNEPQIMEWFAARHG
jgi:hypothetical protein